MTPCTLLLLPIWSAVALRYLKGFFSMELVWCTVRWCMLCRVCSMVDSRMCSVGKPDEFAVLHTVLLRYPLDEVPVIVFV